MLLGAEYCGFAALLLEGLCGCMPLKHPQLSRSIYSNRAVTLIQQSAQNSYSLLIAQYSKNYTIFGLKCPQVQSPGSNFQGGWGHTPRPPRKRESLK